MTGTISEVRQEILRVEWNVGNFLSLQPESAGSCHESPQFMFSDELWCLTLYPNGEEEEYKDSIGLYLNHEESTLSSNVKCTLAVKKTDGSLHWRISFSWKFQGAYCYGPTCLVLKSVLLQKKDEFLHDGALTFCCVLQKAPSSDDMDDLCVDLKKLLASSEHSDVTVKLKSKEYRVHRAVLAARSDVFASALKHDTLGKKTGIIRIEDCDADSFQEFLSHLYTGRADINASNVFHLFRTADKYLVGELKSHCVAFLMENMSVDSVCDAIALAHDHNKYELQNFCKNFFYDNAGIILETSDWTSLMRSHCDAASELLKLIAAKLK